MIFIFLYFHSYFISNNSRQSNEDMILALAGQFKQLSHEPEKFRWLNGIRTHDLCDAGAVLSPTELWSHTVESRSICWAHVFPWKECHMKECYMQCGVWNQMKIWSSHLLDNLSNCLMNLKNSGDSTGFEPMTSAMPVQCSRQLSYEVTQWRAGQFVGLMFSRERNVIWKNVICSAVFEIKWRYDPRTCWTI